MASNKLPAADPFAALSKDDLLADGVKDVTADLANRIQRIPLRFIRADPMQPRRILPYAEHQRYHSEGREPTAILSEIFERVANYLAKRGIEINSPSDLHKLFIVHHQSTRSDADAPEQADDVGSDEHESPLTRHFNSDDDYAAGRLIDLIFLISLYRLARTLCQEGQIYPITIVDRYPKKTQRYVVETGERRFWAMCLASRFSNDFHECINHGTIAAITVDDSPNNAFRQFQENMGREELSAIARGRQAAMALWVANGKSIPQRLEVDFFRRVAENPDLNLRGHAEKVLSVIGEISPTTFSRLLSLNRLSPDAVELADYHRISEKHLRYVLRFDQDEQVALVRAIIRDGLTSGEILDLYKTRAEIHGEAQNTEKTDKPDEDDHNRVAPGLKKGWKSLVLDHQDTPTESDLQALLEITKGDTGIARLYVERTRDRMEALLQQLSEMT